MGSMMQLINSRHTHKIEQAKIDAARVIQKSNNDRSASDATLNNFIQSLANQRKMDAAGAAMNAKGQNIAAMLDKATVGSIQQRIQAAGELGNASVQAAAAGVGGSSVETFQATMRLRSSVQKEGLDRAVAGDNTNASSERAGVIGEAIAGLSNNTYVGNMDRTTYIDHVKQKNVVGAMIAVGVATYFGGPQAGQATSDFIASANNFANNKEAQGNRQMDSAFANGMSALSDYQRTGGNPWGRKGSTNSSGLMGSKDSSTSDSGTGGFFDSTNSDMSNDYQLA